MKYPRILAFLAIGLSCLALVLSWNDVLPGGWNLRGLLLGKNGHSSWVRGRHAAQRLELFSAERETVPAGGIVFLGSSTVERFPLATIFPGRPCLNRGINGDTVSELASRLDESLPAGEPAALLVAIGGNDLRREQQSAAVVGERAAALMDDLARRCPGVPITWIGLFGEREASARELGETRLFNAVTRRAAETRGIDFLSIQRAPLVDLDGRLQGQLAADRYHLNEDGYRLLGEWIIGAGGTVGHLLSAPSPHGSSSQ